MLADKIRQKLPTNNKKQTNRKINLKANETHSHLPFFLAFFLNANDYHSHLPAPAGALVV